MKIFEIKKWGMVIILCGMANYAYPTPAWITENVTSGYSQCQIIQEENNVTAARVMIAFNATAMTQPYTGRALLFASYSKDGWLNSVKTKSSTLDGWWGGQDYPEKGYRIFSGGLGKWKEVNKFTKVAEVRFDSSILSTWPGIAIQVANYTGRGFGVDTKGVYIRADGSCQIVTDTSHAPSASIMITVSAPDWDLGEIKPGEQRIPFISPANRLCLKYNGFAVSGKPFIVTASSENGEINGWYQLKKVADNSAGQKERAAAAAIPYQLVLSNVNDPTNMAKGVKLPNSAQTSLPLDSGVETCFVPEFTTRAPGNISAGNYLDQLTFNIVTKS